MSPTSSTFDTPLVSVFIVHHIGERFIIYAIGEEMGSQRCLHNQLYACHAIGERFFT